MIVKISADTVAAVAAEVDGLIPYLVVRAMTVEAAAVNASMSGAPCDPAGFRIALNEAIQQLRNAVEAAKGIHSTVVTSDAYEDWHEEAYGVRTDGSISDRRKKQLTGEW